MSSQGTGLFTKHSLVLCIEAMTEEDAPTTTPSTENGPEIYKVKVDHFEGIHMLGEENSFEGAPNFRQVCETISNDFSVSMFNLYNM